MTGDHRDWLLAPGPDGKEAPVELGRRAVRIGRGADSQVVLRDSFVSTSHAELVIHEGRRCVRDLGSTNGTLVNGHTIEPGRPTPLQDGDAIQIGESTLTYRQGVPLSDPAPAGQTGGRFRTQLWGLTTGPGPGGAVASPAPPPPSPPTVSPPPRPSAPAVPGPSRPSAPTAPPPRRSSAPIAPASRGRRWSASLLRPLVRIVLILLLAVLVAAGVLWLLAPSRVVLLVLGTDARPDELRRGEVGRTDTLLTVVADRSPSAVGLISVPRDLWVEIPGYGAERINVAYVVGGPAAAERAVGDALGVKVDRYLTIGLQGVRDVVDAAGGVEIDVPHPIHDDAYPTDDYGTMVLDIPAGKQHMDGETALRYTRTRHQDSDFGRTARQQQVMVAVRTALLRPINWWRIPGVLSAVREATSTDLGPLDLATLALAFGASEPERLPLDGVVVEFRGAGGAYLLRATPALRQQVAVFLSPAGAAVEVLNGTSTAGLAMQTADRLRGQGVRVVNVGNAGLIRGGTIVEVRPGFRRAGAHIAERLGLPSAAIHESPLLPAGADVRVTLGEP